MLQFRVALPATGTPVGGASEGEEQEARAWDVTRQELGTARRRHF